MGRVWSRRKLKEAGALPFVWQSDRKRQGRLRPAQVGQLAGLGHLAPAIAPMDTLAEG